MSIHTWSTTPATNTTIDSTDIDENCAPAGINNAIRSVMADVAQYIADMGGALDTTGSGNAYLATTDATWTSYADGQSLLIRANFSNTGSATINVDSLGVKTFKKFDGDGVSNLVSGDIQSGGIYHISYDSGNGYFIILGTSVANISGAVITVDDDNFTVQDNADQTKQFQVQLSGITTGNMRTWTVPDSSDTFVGKATTDTLTNKSVDMANNTLAGTLAQFNAALSDGSFASLAGSETLTNKTLDAAANTLSNIATSMFATNVIDTDATLAANSDTRIASQKAGKAYIDNLITGLKWKPSVIVSSTANLTLSGEQTIDGVLTSTDRVLVRHQSSGAENGIYLTAAGAWARVADANTAAEITMATVFVEQGTANADTQWTMTTDSVTLDTTSLTWAQVSGAGTYSAGAGLVLTANQFAVDGLLEDLDTTGAASADGEFLVATGAGAQAWESGATLRTSIGVGTGNSPHFTALNLGHATDSTITRVSAGRLAIEGSNILMASDIGASVQAYDVELAALAGLTSATDKLPYFTGSEAASVATFTAFARTILDDANAGAVRTTIGAIATVVEDTSPQLGGALDTNAKPIYLSKGADIASGTALALGTDGNSFDVTGTTAITSIGTWAVGGVALLQFDGILTFTHHATDLILPGAGNITTAAGDIAMMYEYASGDWRCISYQRAANAPGGGISNVVEDTTPQLGGNLDGQSNDIDAVNIGPATPGTGAFIALTVRASNPSISITSDDTGQASVLFGGVTNSNKGRIVYSDNSDFMAFYTADAEKYRVNIAGDLLPKVTETQDIGSASLEIDNLYLQNAVTVSDERRKKDIKTIQNASAFLRSLDPVWFKYTDKVIPATTKDVERQVTVTKQREETMIEIVDGKPVLTTKTVDYDEPQFTVEPVLNEAGEVIIRDEVQLTHEMPVMETVQETTDERTISHSRPHTGFIAQKIKAAMGASGYDDWSGYAYDDESDTHLLRLMEMIAFTVKGWQELDARIAALEVE